MNHHINMEQSASTSPNDGLPYLPYDIFLLIAELFLDAAESSAVPADWNLRYDDSTCEIYVCTRPRMYHPGAVRASKQSQQKRFLSFQPIYQANHCVRNMALKLFFSFPVNGDLAFPGAWICPRVDRLHITWHNSWDCRRILRYSRSTVAPFNYGDIRNVENAYLGEYDTCPEFSDKRLKLAMTMLPNLKTVWFSCVAPYRYYSQKIRLTFFSTSWFWSPIPGEISLTGEVLSEARLTANLLQSKGVRVLIEFKGRHRHLGEPAMEVALTDGGKLSARYIDAECSDSNPILKALRHSGRSLLYPYWKPRAQSDTSSS